MAKGVNKVILVGNVGGDPETKAMPSGSMVTNITVATSESWKDKQTGQAQERTEWHRVVFFNRLAEIVNEYVKKGSKVYIEGSLRTRSWEQEGVKRYSTEIVASEMQMLDSRQGGTQQQQAPQQRQQQQAPMAKVPQQYQAPRQAPQQQAQNQQQAKAAVMAEWDKGPTDNFDDAIPF